MASWFALCPRLHRGLDRLGRRRVPPQALGVGPLERGISVLVRCVEAHPPLQTALVKAADVVKAEAVPYPEDRAVLLLRQLPTLELRAAALARGRLPREREQASGHGHCAAHGHDRPAAQSPSRLPRGGDQLARRRHWPNLADLHWELRPTKGVIG